jgi:MFS family permease
MSGGGIGLGGALLITFIVLKLTDVIDWSWWWVLSPIWICLVFAVLAAVAGFAAYKRFERKHFNDPYKWR